MNKCDKLWAFPSREAAMRALRGIPPGRTGRVPIRAYYCKDHRAWHVTSNPRRKPRKKRG